jgi:hypothetical protein
MFVSQTLFAWTLYFQVQDNLFSLFEKFWVHFHSLTKLLMFPIVFCFFFGTTRTRIKMKYHSIITKNCKYLNNWMNFKHGSIKQTLYFQVQDNLFSLFEKFWVHFHFYRELPFYMCNCWFKVIIRANFYDFFNAKITIKRQKNHCSFPIKHGTEMSDSIPNQI